MKMKGGLRSWILLLFLLVIRTDGKNGTKSNIASELSDSDEEGGLLVHVQQRLVTKLLKDYNTNVRPVSNPSKNLSVAVTPSIRQIVQVNEKQQVVTLYFWLRIFWYDKNLVWNKTEFRNLSQINIPPESIWLPDIALVNSAQEGQDALIYRKITTNVQVRNDGRCRWLSPYFSSSSCNIDSTNFPFDQQTCTVEMASWTQSGLKIDVDFADTRIDTRSYLENIQWKLVSTSAHKEVKHYASSPDPFPSLMFNFVFRRRSLFYIINLIFPCVILSVLSLMTFYIPVASGERITLSISLLLTMLFTLYIVTENLPPDSTTVPLLTKFIGVAMLIMTLSLFATSIGIKFEGKAELMPQWMMVLINKYLACLVLHDTTLLSPCITKRHCRPRTPNEDQPESTRILPEADTDNPNTCRHRPEAAPGSSAAGSSNPGALITGGYFPVMSSIAAKFRYITKNIEKKNAEEELEVEWKKAGEVLNKLFFWSFLAVLLFASIAVFSHAQYTE